MELGCCGDFKFEDATSEQIAGGLAALGQEDGSFMILHGEDGRFMQCLGGALGFLVEYHDQPEGRHFRSSSEAHSKEELERIFGLYLVGDPSFRRSAHFLIDSEFSET